MTRRIGLLIAVACLLLPASARAITVADLIELSRAGLADEVLVELIGLDTAQPAPTPADLLDMQEAGVSPAVLVAFLKNARRNVPPDTLREANAWERTNAPASASDAPDVVVAPSQTVTVVEPPAPSAGPIYMPFFVPVWGVPVAHPRPSQANVRTAPTLDQQPGFGRFMNNGWRPAPPPSVWDIGTWTR